MKKEQRKTRMYVQLGKRYTNGRIAKAENYDINNFFSKCVAKGGFKIVKVPKITKYDCFFKTKRYADFLVAQNVLFYYNLFETLMSKGIVVLIEKDSYGRKKEDE